MEAVFHRKLPVELEVMPFNLWLMELVGIWGDRKNFCRFIFAVGCVIAIILFPKGVLGIGSSDFDAISKGVAEFFYWGCLIASVIIFVINRSHFEQIIYKLRLVFTMLTDNDQQMHYYEAIRKLNINMHEFAKIYAVYCSCSPFLFCIPPMTTSYVRYFTVTGNGSESLKFELPMEQEFYGLQIRTNFLHYHIFVGLSLLAYYCSALLSLIKITTMIFMIKYSSLTYRMLADKIRGLDQKGPQHVQKKVDYAFKISELVEIIHLHQLCFEITDHIEEIVNIPMAMQYLTCIMYWCLTMFYASMNINLSLLNVIAVPLFLSCMETYGFSYLGTELTIEAENVGSSIYNLPWYQESVELQRYYRLIIQRIQRTTGVSASKFFLVGIRQFGNVVHTSYTYYVVLKDALAAR